MIEPEIVYEDRNFLAINKPAGMLVHQTRNNAELTRINADNIRKNQRNNLRVSAVQQTGTLVDWLLRRYPEIKNVGDDPVNRPGIVHRLDRETSGIMLIPKNQTYFEYLKSLFKNRQIKKKYLALVAGKVAPEMGVIEKPIGIKDGTVRRSVHSKKMAKEAVTKYRATRYLESRGSQVAGREKDKIFSLVEVEPQTGRTHQIRVHMASIGHPVLGDTLYGGKAGRGVAGRLMLHAQSLEFTLRGETSENSTSGDGKRIKLEADIPADYAKVMGKFGSAH